MPYFLDKEPKVYFKLGKVEISRKSFTAISRSQMKKKDYSYAGLTLLIEVRVPVLLKVKSYTPESVILMVVISITMILFGMKTDNALLIGLIMGVMNVIPYAGPLIGGIISACIGIIAPIEGMTAINTFFTIGFTLFGIKAFDDFVLQPTIYSERVKAHPLEVFLVILIAGYMAGIVGMLLAIPSYTVLRVLAKEFFSELTLVQKLTQNI